MDFTNFDAIEFSYNSITHIRLYYQTKDKVLRESSFETANGWFVRTNGVIATNAKEKSPITATRWEKDGQVNIRVYFLDENNIICESVGTHTSTGTVWKSTSPPNVPVRNAAFQKARAASGSSLAIARPGVDEETLRLFYQVESVGKFPICEIRYQFDEDSWTLQRRQIEGAAKNSRFSAASAGRAGAVRVYYVDSKNALRVAVWNSPFSRWEEFEVGDTDFILAPEAPISAVCWYEKPPYDDFRVRIYTILRSNPTEIVELARNGDDWKKELRVVDLGPGASTQPTVALSRNKRANVHNPISVFYQPDRHVIDVAIPDRERKISPATAVALKPQGLPTARGPLPHAQNGPVPPGYQYVPDGFELVQSGRVIPPGHKVVPGNAVILQSNEKAVPGDAVILQPGEKAVPGDAIILQPGEKAVPGDAVILQPSEKAVPGYAVILQPGQKILQPREQALPDYAVNNWNNTLNRALQYTLSPDVLKATLEALKYDMAPYVTS